MALHAIAEQIAKLKALGYWNGSLEGSLISFKVDNGLRARNYYGPITDEKLFSKDVKPNTRLPAWMLQGYKLFGLKEYSGSRHNKQILEFWKTLQLPFHDDETPWCAGFVGYCLEKSGIKSTRSAMARSYSDFGVKLDTPTCGAIAVFWRGSKSSSSGHVAFVAGHDEKDGRMLILGGNQGDSVSIIKADKRRLLTLRWPASVQVPTLAYMPKLKDYSKQTSEV